MARKTIDEKIAEAKKKEQQYANNLKKLKKQKREIEQKRRTKRLIEKGAIFESLVEESKDFSSDEYKLLIESFVTTDEFKLKLLEIKELSEKRTSDEENAEMSDNDIDKIAD